MNAHLMYGIVMTHVDIVRVAAWPRLRAWLDWFLTTQAGSLPGTFRWRGRNNITDRELNPKTFASGSGG